MQSPVAEFLGEQHHEEREESACEEPGDATEHGQRRVVVDARQHAHEAAGERHAAHEQDALRQQVQVGHEAEADAADHVGEPEDRDEEGGARLADADQTGVVGQHDVERRVAGEDEHRRERVDEEHRVGEQAPIEQPTTAHQPATAAAAATPLHITTALAGGGLVVVRRRRRPRR